MAISVASPRVGRRLNTRALVWWFHMALGPALFLILLSNPLLDQVAQAPQSHFFVVSFAAVGGLVIAWTVARSARSHADARVFFIALAFFGIAAIFLMHSLSTANAFLDQGESGFIWSPPLCLLVGSIFFLLSSFRFGDRANDWIVVNQNRLLVGLLAILLGYAVVVILFPDFIVSGLGLSTGSDGYSVSGEGGAANQLLIGMLTVSVLCFCISAFRYYRQYQKRASVLILSLFTGMVLFAEADLFMAFSTAWRVSWWLYHFVMVMAFLMVGYGILVQFNRRGNLYGLFDQLFLRQEIARLNQNYTEVMIGLINALEAKDKYTKGHSARVAQYALLLARGMGYDEADQRRVEQAALLHDIGKLAIPDAILNKPGRLTAEEFAFIQSHPRRGCAIIQSIDSLQDKIPGILHHHEWMDGSGYPDHLAGDEIPLDARIIAVADVYDAMTSLRAYRQPLTQDQAVDHLRKEAGSHLDASCVEAFVDQIHRNPVTITDFTAQLSVHDLVPESREPVGTS